MDSYIVKCKNGTQFECDEAWIAVSTDGKSGHAFDEDVKILKVIREPIVTSNPIQDLTDDAQDQIIDLSTELLNQAARAGYVITVETKPCEPLAMGNYRMVGNVRGAR